MQYITEKILFPLCLRVFSDFAYLARREPRLYADVAPALCPKRASNCRTRVEPTHAEAGCLTYEIFESEDGRLFLFETWRSRADLEAHFEKPYIKNFRALAPSLTDQDQFWFVRRITGESS